MVGPLDLSRMYVYVGMYVLSISSTQQNEGEFRNDPIDSVATADIAMTSQYLKSVKCLCEECR